MRNTIQGRVVTTAEQMQHAIAVRSIVYMEGNGLPYDLVFDGNDNVSTHVVFYSKDEPIGCARLRWFAGFAKVERFCLRAKYQNVRNLRASVEFVFDHVAQKGYSVLITHANEKYGTLWCKLFGFELAQDRPVIESVGYEPHFEFLKRLTPPVDAIRSDTAPPTLSRIEGSWDLPGAWDAPPARD